MKECDIFGVGGVWPLLYIFKMSRPGNLPPGSTLWQHSVFCRYNQQCQSTEDKANETLKQWREQKVIKTVPHTRVRRTHRVTPLHLSLQTRSTLSELLRRLDRLRIGSSLSPATTDVHTLRLSQWSILSKYNQTNNYVMTLKPSSVIRTGFFHL